MRLAALLCPLLFSAALPVYSAAAAPQLQLTLIRDDDRRFHVEAEARVHAPEAVVVATVRDYDHLTDFIPTIVFSRRIDYEGRPAIEQIGQARFLFFSFRAHTII